MASLRAGVTAAGAVSLCLLLASTPALGVATMGWSAPVVVTSHANTQTLHPLASTGGLSAVAAYDIDAAGSHVVRVKRTVDGGETWLPAVTISAPGGYAGYTSVAADGKDVAVTFAQGDACAELAPEPNTCPLMLAMSTNGGMSFATAIKIATMGDLGLSDVAINNDLVLVAWTDRDGMKVKARVSTDTGQHFGSTRILGTAPGGLYEGSVSAAAAAGVLYVAYHSKASPDFKIRVRRSLDGGSTWKPPVAVAVAGTYPSVLAVGTTVLVSYTILDAHLDVLPAVNRSTNRGASFGARQLLSPSTKPDARGAVVAYGHGVYRAVFGRCLTNACHHEHMYLRSSTSGGAHWSKAVDIGIERRYVGLAVGRTIILGITRGAVTSTQQLDVIVGSH